MSVSVVGCIRIEETTVQNNKKFPAVRTFFPSWLECRHVLKQIGVSKGSLAVTSHKTPNGGSTGANGGAEQLAGSRRSGRQ